MLRIIMIAIAALIVVASSAQVEGEVVARDSVMLREDKDGVELRKSPARASMLSAVLPGAGQVYNEKYWKLPIVYAGLGTSVFFILDNRSQYLKFKEAYLMDIDDDSTTSSVYAAQNISPAQLRAAADQYRLWMEWSYIATGIVYVLQIVDAAVDAHLYYFNVSDDLTLNWRPEVFTSRNQRMVTGLSLNLAF